MGVAGGIIERREELGGLDWEGRATLGVRLPGHVTVRGRVERAPYFETLASLQTPVMTETAAVLLHWDDPRGWLGEIAYQRQRYPDDNAAKGSSGWLLAPILHQRGTWNTDVQIGYAFGVADADEMRYALVHPAQPYPPDDPRYDFSGQYSPYYTPSGLVTHAVIGTVAVRPTPSTTLRASGSVPIRATDNAPIFYAAGNDVLLATYPRTFSPWNARASAEVRLRNGLTVAATGELGRSAFYAWAAGGVQFTYRFTTVGAP
jgi:hypothetical protein